MPKQPPSRKRAASAEYDSDGGFVEDAPKSKKSKSNNGSSNVTLSFEVKKDDEGNEYWDISNTRRLALSEFKGKTLVSVREYYADPKSGKMRPGKKGISLNLDQFNAVVELLPQVEALLKSKGQHVPRPQYEVTSGKNTVAEEDEPDEDGKGEEKEGKIEKPSKSAKSKLDKFKHKANHEATSDEDDD